MLAAALLLLAYTLARPGPALVALAGLLLGAGRAEAQRPTEGSRALAAGDEERAAAEFLKEASRGTARDTAFYNAGSAALDAGRLDVARGALSEAAKSLDPGIRYRALYNLGVVGLLAAEADTSRAEEFLDEAADRLRQALMLEPSSARAKWNLELATRRKPPPPPAGGGGGGDPSVRRWRRAKPATAHRIEEPGTHPEPGGADPQLDGPAGAGNEGGAAAEAADRLGRRGEGLVIALLLAALVVQAEPPTLDASVDQDRVMVGEEVTYRLRATSRTQAPMELTVAPFTGLETVSRSERTELSLGATATRTTVLEVRLRAVRPGRWQLGPARAVQGRDTVEASALVLDVSASHAPATAALNPRLRKLLAGAQPPRPGQAAVDLIVSADSVSVGEQVDVITAAWFPRDLRVQLRRPPTLQPPVIDAVWSYPQSAPAGIADTRSIGGRWYDLFIAHQVVFPLLSGRVVIPHATLKYSTPVALQFFSQEERFALASRADTLAGPADSRGRTPGPLQRRDRLGAAGWSGGSHPHRPGSGRRSRWSWRSRAPAIPRSGPRRCSPGPPRFAPTPTGWTSG